MTLLFLDLGTGEVLLIVLAIFLVFGPGKIPEMARGLGKFVNEIKRASEDVKNEINREANRIEREEKLKEYQKKIDLDDDSEIPAEKKKTRKTKASVKETPSVDADIVQEEQETKAELKKSPKRKPAASGKGSKAVAKDATTTVKKPKTVAKKPKAVVTEVKPSGNRSKAPAKKPKAAKTKPVTAKEDTIEVNSTKSAEQTVKKQP